MWGAGCGVYFRTDIHTPGRSLQNSPHYIGKMTWNYVSRNVWRLRCGGCLVFMSNKSLAHRIEDEINEVTELTFSPKLIFQGYIFNQSFHSALLVIHTQACTSQILHIVASFQPLCSSRIPCTSARQRLSFLLRLLLFHAYCSLHSIFTLPPMFWRYFSNFNDTFHLSQLTQSRIVEGDISLRAREGCHSSGICWTWQIPNLFEGKPRHGHSSMAKFFTPRSVAVTTCGCHPLKW